MRVRRSVGLAAVMVLAGVVAGCGGSNQPGGIEIVDAWAPVSPPVAETAVFYMRIINTGPDDRLTSASSPACTTMGLHDTIEDRGLLVMERVEDGIELPAGREIVLELAGLHLMCIDKLDSFSEGETLELRLAFQLAPDMTLDVPVTGR